jgi:tetratricopeptide (TPR) repeat protein
MRRETAKKIIKQVQTGRVPGASLPQVPAIKTEVPVSVTIIAKDCADSLKYTLESLRRTFLTPIDEVLVVDTGSAADKWVEMTKLAKEYGARLVHRPELRKNLRPFVRQWLPELERRFEETDLVEGCILDFAEARTVAFEEAKNDIQFWIDADDILEETGPFRLRRTVEQVLGKSRQVDAIFMDYAYWIDPSDGSVTSILKRERVFDRKKVQWVGRCHETAIPKPGVEFIPGYFHDLGARITHRKTVPDGKTVSAADIRNYIIIRREIEEDKAAGRTPDPRSIFYLGNAARGVRHVSEALELYKQFIPLSGSPEDRYAACYYIASIYLESEIGRPYDAIDWLQKCVKIKPSDPRSYFGLQRAYHQLQQWDASNFWFEVGRKLPEPVQTTHNYDPRHIHALPFQVRAMTAIRQERKEDLIQAMNDLVARSPNHAETKSLSEYASNWLAGEQLVESVQRVLANCHPAPEDAIEKGRELTSKLTDFPEKIENLFLGRVEPPPFNADRPQLDIFCGKAVEAWGPKSGIKGIGGSEKAVIQMAPRLQKRGYQVNVYCNVPRDQRGIDAETGVNWQHFGSYDFKRKRDTVIYWRGVALLESKFKYRRRILWCHDVQRHSDWTPVRAALADQVWVLTDFHKSTLGEKALGWLGDKVRVTRNGIDAARLREVRDAAAGKRDPFKVIYASSPDRGVLTSMKIFERARVLEPRLKLHVFYGFNKLFIENLAKVEYGHVPDLGRDAHLGEYWSEVLATADRLEIPWHGRVGWDELAAHMATAGVWLYPTRFPEISCMSFMEQAALGCVPVHSGLYALKETSEGRGLIVTPDDLDGAAKAVVQATKATETERAEISEWALSTYDYERLADEWCLLLKEGGEE